MVFGTEVLCLLIETGYEPFGVDWHLVATAAKPLYWNGVVLDASAARTDTGYRDRACSS